MEESLVLHLHHHFVFYFDSAHDALANSLSLEKSNSLQIHLEESMDLTRSFANWGEEAGGEGGDGASHVHRHLFHRIHRMKDFEGKDAYIKRAEEQLVEKGRVVHHIYDSVERSDVASQRSRNPDLKALRSSLRVALRVEISTIPLYLYALYSIKDRKSEEYLLIKSIAAEEMLHAGLVANLLVAVGGVPSFYDDKAIPSYPYQVPVAEDLVFNLEPLSADSLDKTFLRLELPSSEDDETVDTIGKFYREIEGSIEALCKEKGVELFGSPSEETQLRPKNYEVVKYNVLESGTLITVNSLETARAAIAVIVHQGEGLTDDQYADEGHRELTHFHKLQLIRGKMLAQGLDVYPLPTNPTTADFPEDVQLVSNCFNAAYNALMLTLQELYADSDKRGALNTRMYVLMEKIMRPCAFLLVEQPLDDKTNCAPTFERYLFSKDPVEEVREMAKEVLEKWGDKSEVVKAKMSKGLKKFS